jgi:hypothetical protein
MYMDHIGSLATGPRERERERESEDRKEKRKIKRKKGGLSSQCAPSLLTLVPTPESEDVTQPTPLTTKGLVTKDGPLQSAPTIQLETKQPLICLS